MGNGLIPALLPQGLDVFVGIDSSGIDVFATTSTQVPTPINSLCPQQQIANASITLTSTFAPTYINLQKGTFHPINFFVSPDGNQIYIVTSDQGVLVYNFSTGTTNAIPLVGNGNPAPVAADMTVDGTLLYVAGTDGVLHELNTQTGLDVMEIPFPQLANSSNNFCYQSNSCSLNIVAIKP
jgi:outer membrane protein assembly factor BamB